jgi:hypothetical protein
VHLTEALQAVHVRRPKAVHVHVHELRAIIERVKSQADSDLEGSISAFRREREALSDAELTEVASAFSAAMQRAYDWSFEARGVRVTGTRSAQLAFNVLHLRQLDGNWRLQHGVEQRNEQSPILFGSEQHPEHNIELRS